MKLTLNIFLRVTVIIIIFYSSLIAEGNALKLTIQNPTDLTRKDEYVKILLVKTVINPKEISKESASEDSFTLLVNDNPVPFQLESNIYGEKYICFVTDFKPKEIKAVVIKHNDEKVDTINVKSRTYAELAMKVDYEIVDGKYTGGNFRNFNKVSVPHTHKDHDALFKYEGPGWESELVGYRFYLDQRNSTDIFGKKRNELVLKDVGVNDIYAKDDSYHNMQPWGMDIFNVGASLGIGSIGMWYNNKVVKVENTDSITCEIAENGPVKSEVRTNYYGWQVGKKKYNLSSSFSITAGSRLTKHEIKITGKAENLVTGLAKFDGTNFIKSNNKKGWNYIAIYGKQSLANDSLGIAVLYNNQNFVENLEDNLSYIVKLKPIKNNLAYYFCAAWEQEPDGIKNQEEFIEYLDQLIVKMNNPIIVK